MRTINFADIEKERLCDYSLFEYAHLGDCFRGEITPIGDFFMCLTDPEKSSFVFKLPKIPIYIFGAISGFFSYIANEYNTSGFLCREVVYYAKQKYVCCYHCAELNSA